MQIQLTTPAGKTSKTSIEVSDVVFGRDYNEPLVHQAVTAYLAGGRAGTRAQKTRSQVRGGGAKPWRQKGTGRARAGTIRSPLWKGGGQTFAAVPANHSQKLNRKMYRGALSSILSELIRQDRLIVVDSFALDAPKTSELLGKLKGFDADSMLIVSDQADNGLEAASRNLHKIDVCNAAKVNPVSLIKREKVLITKDALKKIEERLV